MRFYVRRKYKIKSFSLRKYTEVTKGRKAAHGIGLLYALLLFVLAEIILGGIIFLDHYKKSKDLLYLNHYVQNIGISNAKISQANKQLARFKYEWLSASWDQYSVIERIIGTLIENLPQSVAIQQLVVTKNHLHAIFLSRNRRALDTYLSVLRSNYLFSRIRIEVYSFQDAIYTLGIRM